jgi:hypothetical protein
MASYNTQSGAIVGDVDAGYVATINQIVASRFAYSARVLETDYYRYLLEGADVRPE